MTIDPNPARLRLCGHEPPLEQRNDDDLMLLACAGMREAFVVILRRHQPAVRNFCARICRSAVTADDVAQEVFVALWQSRATFEPKGRFRSYLFAIAVSRCRNELRRQSVNLLSLEESAVGSVSTLPLDALVATERSKRLYALVAKLPPDQRQAITLHFAAGLDYSEIAAVAKSPVATVRSRVFLGLVRLRKLIAIWGQS